MARQIFLVFVVCALVPVTSFAVFSFIQVSDQLETAARDQLRADSKSSGMTLLERMSLLEEVLRTVGAGEVEGFVRVLRFDESSGHDELLPKTPNERKRLVRGGALLRVVHSGEGTAIFLVRASGSSWPEASEHLTD